MASEIKVKYGDLETVVKDIQALEAMAKDYTSITLSMSNSKGKGKEGLHSVAKKLELVAKAQSKLLGTTAEKLSELSVEFKKVDDAISKGYNSEGKKK
jgi:phage protein U